MPAPRPLASLASGRGQKSWYAFLAIMLSTPKPLKRIQSNLLSDLPTPVGSRKAHYFCPPPPILPLNTQRP